MSKLEFLEKEAETTKRESQKSLHEFLVPKKRLSTSTKNEDSDDLFSDQSTIPPSDSEVDITGNIWSFHSEPLR